MHTLNALSLSPSSVTPRATKFAKLAGLALLAGSLAVLAPVAQADDFNAVLGAGIGAVAGAAIGKSVDGRNGAILGAGAGGLVGASIASQNYSGGYAPNPYPAQSYYYQQQQQPPAYYQHQQPVAVYQAPQQYYYAQPQYRVVQPITYYQERPQPQPRYWREERRDHHHHENREYNRGHGGYYNR